mgnify:CR=1 FL=1
MSIVLAVLIWRFAATDPAVLFQLLGILLGIELLMNGASLIALAFFLRTAKGAVRDKLEQRFTK